MFDKHLNQQIQLFSSVFHRYVCEISRLSFDKKVNRYQKVLYFTLLEALAKARYPTDRPSNAFSSFMGNHCAWKENKKISLPHLVAALERTSEPAFNDTQNYFFEKFAKWSSGGPVYLDFDLEMNEVQQKWPKNSDDKSMKIPELGIDWTSCQHRKLLYAYRSKLSHESRESTISFEDIDDFSPYYESVQLLSSSEQQWHLVYPSGFLENLCRTGIESLKVWLMNEGKNPYERFQFGHYLIDALNNPKKQVCKPSNSQD